MALSKAVTLLDWSRRKLRISVVMLMMPPTQECFVPLGQNHQWNFRTTLAVLRCEFLGERAGSAALRERINPNAIEIEVKGCFNTEFTGDKRGEGLGDSL